jgi:hypothetical protein
MRTVCASSPCPWITGGVLVVNDVLRSEPPGQTDSPQRLPTLPTTTRSGARRARWTLRGARLESFTATPADPCKDTSCARPILLRPTPRWHRACSPRLETIPLLPAKSHSSETHGTPRSSSALQANDGRREATASRRPGHVPMLRESGRVTFPRPPAVGGSLGIDRTPGGPRVLSGQAVRFGRETLPAGSRAREGGWGKARCAGLVRRAERPMSGQPSRPLRDPLLVRGGKSWRLSRLRDRLLTFVNAGVSSFAYDA